MTVSKRDPHDRHLIVTVIVVGNGFREAVLALVYDPFITTQTVSVDGGMHRR